MAADATTIGRSLRDHSLRDRGLSRRMAVVSLGALVACSAVVRVALGRQVPAPFFFLDELGYERMANSLARHGSLALFGKTGTAYAPLYAVVLAPIYALTRSAAQAYAWSKDVNAVLMSLSAVPVYGIARFVLSRPRSLGVAALSLTAPLMFYSDLELSENLAYPLFLVAVWMMLHALRNPCPLNDGLLLVAIAAASAARLQSIALLPAALTATLLLGRRRAVREHVLLFAISAAVGAAAVARAVANGGALPLAGRYANVGSARASPLRVLELAAQHLAAFDLAIGVVPFIGALAAAYALVRFGFPRRELLFGAAALATTFWLLLEVGFDAAAFDRDYVQHVGQQIPADASRFHERYLIYLVPLFLTATVAALRTRRPRLRVRAHLSLAAAAALLALAIPFATFVNDTTVVESFGLQIFARNVGGTVLPFAHVRLVAFAMAAVLGLFYLYALLRPRPSFAIVVTAFVFAIFSSVVRVRVIGASQTLALAPPQARWVDRTVGGAEATFVGGGRGQEGPIVETVFDNLAITRLYFVCVPAFDEAFGERPLTVDASGEIRGAPFRAQYVVAPTSLGVRGRVVARYPQGGLELVQPPGAVVSFSPGGAAAGCRR